MMGSLMKNFLKSEVIERGRELRLSFPSVCLPFNLTIFQMSVLASFHVHGMSLQLFGFLEGVAIVLSKFEESSGSSGIGFRMCMLGENPSETKELCCTGEIKKLGIGRLGGFQLSGRRNQETVEAFGHGTLRFEGVEGIGRTTRKKQWRVDSPAYQIYERMLDFSLSLSLGLTKMLARFSHSPECVNRHYRNREQIQLLLVMRPPLFGIIRLA
ncbi:uncharacterized protein [Physcomitrium patens]|uniref:uncharacterized protein isoform X1 n=1 Tax=Physcomitrium patens TaxID=3218 RepID=UPI003CCD7ABA